MAQVVGTLCFGDDTEDVADSSADGVDAPCGGTSREGLDLCEQHFDWIEVRRVGREEARFCASRLDGRAGFGVLVNVEVVTDDDIALAEGGRECPLDPDDEGIAVHWTGDQHGRDDAVATQSGDEGVVLPMAMRHGANTGFSPFRPTPQPRHLGVESAFVDE